MSTATDHGKPRTAEDRKADAKKILANRPRRGDVDPANPKARVMPNVMSPAERVAASKAAEAAAEPVVAETVANESAEPLEVLIDEDPKPRKKGK